MPTTRRNLSIALPSGFAVALCVGAGANKMIALSSRGPAAEAVGLLSVGAGDQRQAGDGDALYSDARFGGSRRESVPNAGAGDTKTGSPDRLLSAIIAVESGGDPLAEGDYEDPVRKLRPRAIGLLQIHKILVDDCARLAPGEHFTYADRLDPERSRAMFRVYQQHYNPTGDIERGARIWVGGPDGWKQDSTLPYLARVRNVMEEQR